MKSRFLPIIHLPHKTKKTEKCGNTVAPVLNSVQYYTINHSFLPDGYGIVSDVSTIQITLSEYSAIVQNRPNLLLDLPICPVLMRSSHYICLMKSKMRTIYSAHIIVETPHIDANFTSPN